MRKANILFISAGALAPSTAPIRSPIPVTQRTSACGSTVGGIALCLSRSASSDSLTLEIENEGARDAVLDIGVALANGTRQYPTAVHLILTDSGGVTHRAELAEPAVVGGRLDPLVLPLPAGAALRLPLAFSKFALSDAAGHLGGIGLVAGERYTAMAELTGRAVRRAEANLDMKGLSLMPYWAGTATSDAITRDAGQRQ
jgi:hypothetical protein